MVSLSGASALVLGASGGLGRHISSLLSDGGSKVTMVGRDESRLASVAADGPRLVADMRDAAEVERVVVAASNHGSGLDIVVNAVGVVAFGPATELPTDVIEELFLTNTFVPIFVSQSAIPKMNPGGVLVNISGVIAEKNLPGMAAYGASKAAVRSWDEAIAREARRAKITVLDARPGHTETGLANRPIAGEAPKFSVGMQPESVAEVIVQAIVDGTADLPSTAFDR